MSTLQSQQILLALVGHALPYTMQKAINKSRYINTSYSFVVQKYTLKKANI